MDLYPQAGQPAAVSAVRADALSRPEPRRSRRRRRRPLARDRVERDARQGVAAVVLAVPLRLALDRPADLRAVAFVEARHAPGRAPRRAGRARSSRRRSREAPLDLHLVDHAASRSPRRTAAPRCACGPPSRTSPERRAWARACAPCLASARPGDRGPWVAVRIAPHGEATGALPRAAPGESRASAAAGSSTQHVAPAAQDAVDGVVVEVHPLRVHHAELDVVEPELLPPGAAPPRPSRRRSPT